MFLKILVGIATAFAMVVGAGLSGLSFIAWPTSFGDHELSVTPAVIHRLRELQAERKFGPDPAAFYFGAMHEDQRLVAQAAVDSTIQSLLAELPAQPRRSTVLRVMKVTLSTYSSPESEERDQLLVYLTKVMRICGVESSGELFNVWRYGFPLGWLP